jgi:hypothetical protein
MIIIAICACFLPMMAGISGFMAYRGSKFTEKGFREGASAIGRQTRGESDNFARWDQVATELERRSDLAASNAQSNWDSFAAAAALVGLGMISGGLAITLRVWYGPSITTRSRPAYYLFSACSTLALILLASFALAAVLHIYAHTSAVIQKHV